MLLLRSAGGTLKRIDHERSRTALYLTGTPFATADVRLLHHDKLPLRRRIYFPRLRDDEIFTLKETERNLKLSEPEQKELFETMRYEIQTLSIGDDSGRFIQVVRMHP